MVPIASFALTLLAFFVASLSSQSHIRFSPLVLVLGHGAQVHTHLHAHTLMHTHTHFATRAARTHAHTHLMLVSFGSDGLALPCLRATTTRFMPRTTVGRAEVFHTCKTPLPSRFFCYSFGPITRLSSLAPLISLAHPRIRSPLSGRAGAPNARLIARLANHPEVTYIRAFPWLPS